MEQQQQRPQQQSSQPPFNWDFLRLTPTETLIVQTIGIIWLIYWIAYRPLKLFLTWCVNNLGASRRSARVMSPPEFGKSYAIITGATDGIGLQYAKQLAKRGYRLLLLSRTESKLTQTAEQLKLDYPQCEVVQTLAVDFTKLDIYDRIEAKLSTLDQPIHVLVNNIGVFLSVPTHFNEYPPDCCVNMINANTTSCSMMCQLVLKRMMENFERQQEQQKQQQSSNDDKKCKKKKKATSAVTQKKPKYLGVNGIVINISSTVGDAPYPLFANYAASKAYVTSFSDALSIEYEQYGILIQTVKPNQVTTASLKRIRTPLFAVPVDSYVNYAVNTVGSEQCTAAHPKHKLLNNLSNTMDRIVGYRLAMYGKYWMMSRMREEALKKIDTGGSNA